MSQLMRNPSAAGGSSLRGPLHVFDHLLSALPLQMRETPTHHHLVVDLPGMGPEDVDVELRGATLAIRAEARGRAYRYSASLPRSADPDAIDAAVAHGVLTIRIGKRADAQPRKIRVDTGRVIDVTSSARPRLGDRLRAWWQRVR